MFPRYRLATIAILGVMALAVIQIGCSGGDKASSDQTPTPEAKWLARSKCDQAARIFYEDTADPEGLRTALALYEEAIVLDPELVQGYVGRGAVYRSGVHSGWFEQTQSLEKAEASFERAIELDPTYMPAYVGLIWVHFSRGDPEAILQTGDRARKSGGTAREIRATRAWAYLMALMPDLTLDLIEPSLAANRPKDPEFQFLLVMALTWAGRYGEAIREGQRFLETFGEDPEMHLWIAVANHCLGDLDAAKTHYDRAMELLGSHTNFYLPAFAGICYEELGLEDESKDIWEKARIIAESRLDIIQDNDVLLQSVEMHRILLGESIHTRSTYLHALLAGAFARLDRVEEAVRVIDDLEAGAIFLRSSGRVYGLRDIDAPPYREALERLEAREARLRELYGPL